MVLHVGRIWWIPGGKEAFGIYIIGNYKANVKNGASGRFIVSIAL